MIYGDTFIVTKYRDSDTYDVVIPDDEAKSHLFYDDIYYICYHAAKIIAFSDCSDEEVVFICAAGRKLRYKGWQPNMVYEFEDVETGEIVFSRAFPEWDH